jgi:hypothetical protein
MRPDNTSLGVSTMSEIEQFTDPERKLWANVLLQALADLSGRDFQARSARAWISSRDNSVGSFSWVCYQLSLDPDAVRQRILRKAARDSALRLGQPTNRAA